MVTWRSSHRFVGYSRLGGSGSVCRVIGRRRGMHDAAPATLSCLASRVCVLRVTAHRALREPR
eukprot:3145547-Prymnesium_polylepis.1